MSHSIHLAETGYPRAMACHPSSDNSDNEWLPAVFVVLVLQSWLSHLQSWQVSANAANSQHLLLHHRDWMLVDPQASEADAYR